MRMWVIGLAAVAAMWSAAESADKTTKVSSALEWERLAAFLPETIPGFVAGKPSGGVRAVSDPESPERQISHSSARCSYVRETAEGEQSFINVILVDAGRSRLVLEPFLPDLSYVRAEDREVVEVAGYRAIEVVELGESDIALGVVYVLLGERMGVVVVGEGIREMAEVREVARGIDFAGLEKAMVAKK